MPRGLSELQRWILQRAAEEPDQNGEGKGFHLATWRVVHEYYGIPTRYDLNDSWVQAGPEALAR
jgi:hypothetical protein